MVTDVISDFGGDSRYVTVSVLGAQFQENAIVKLTRPGLAEYEPVRQRFVDRTRIDATFDLTDAPHGLYDLTVINTTDQRATLPYRFQIEQALPYEVTVGVGGPRVVLAGDTGTYSVALQGRGNLDTPYIHYEVGIPEMGFNPKVYGLPFVTFASNVRGAPESDELADVPWASLDSSTNTQGYVSTSGYMLDQAANGFNGFTFNVATYPGLEEMHDRAYERLRGQLSRHLSCLCRSADG